MRRVAFVPAVLAALAAAGCSSAAISKPHHADQAAAAPSSAASSPDASFSASASASAPQAGSVGDTFTITGTDDNDNTIKYDVTLVKVIAPAHGSDEYTTPDSGKRFVGAVFTVKDDEGNVSDEDANSDASAVGGNNQTYTADFSTIEGYTNFNHGDLNVAAGQTVTGALTFQVPEGVSVSRVLWQPGGIDNSSATWNLSS
jgi:hypothetical protein